LARPVHREKRLAGWFLRLSKDKMQITVYGLPAPQGSKKFVGVKGGRGIMIESCPAVRPWRESIKCAAIESGGRVAGPVFFFLTFTLPRPRSASKKRIWPDRKPDLSKLIRAVEDALTDAGVWEDDARIVMCLSAKYYVAQCPAALDRPGVVIVIEEAKRIYDDSLRVLESEIPN